MIAALHVLPLIAIVQGTNPADWILFAVMYPIQLAGVGVCLHRYFAHNSFRTSRGFQFVLALVAGSTFGNPIRFAGKHRLHHRHSDRPGDPHSPRYGLWYSWIGSHLDTEYSEEEILAQVPGLLRYPELVWLYRNWRVPGLVLCLAAAAFLGFSGMAVGVMLGAAIMLHLSSAVNYFCHRSGYRRFETKDDSTNNWIVSLLTAGEGWHNNHHRFPVSARAGFAWWEIDPFYWLICLFERLGLVWDVRRPPEQIRTAGLLIKSSA